MFEIFTRNKTKEIIDLKAEVERLNKEMELANEIIDYEERRRSLAELKVELLLEQLEHAKSGNHV